MLVKKKHLPHGIVVVEGLNTVLSVKWLSDGIDHRIFHMITGHFENRWTGLGKRPCNISPLVRPILLMWLAQAFRLISPSHIWCQLWLAVTHIPGLVQQKVSTAGVTLFYCAYFCIVTPRKAVTFHICSGDEMMLTYLAKLSNSFIKNDMLFKLSN